jgi:hypothetical protein
MRDEQWVMSNGPGKNLPITAKAPLKRFTLTALLLIVTALAAPAYAQTVPLYGKTLIRYSSAAESRLLLGARDAFVAAMSPYDRGARTTRRGPFAETK